MRAVYQVRCQRDSLFAWWKMFEVLQDIRKVVAKGRSLVWRFRRSFWLPWGCYVGFIRDLRCVRIFSHVRGAETSYVVLRCFGGSFRSRTAIGITYVCFFFVMWLFVRELLYVCVCTHASLCICENGDLTLSSSSNYHVSESSSEVLP